MHERDNAHRRRASYGPSSPTVGARGERTRQQILDAALAGFTEHGFHSTSMEDIAVRADTSRATLYQYFASKEAIFLELTASSGAAVRRVTRRLGTLGATAEGYDNLHWWLGEWTWVFDRYASMFIEWVNVSLPTTPLQPQVDEFLVAHNDRFAQGLIAGGMAEDEARLMSNLVFAMVTRYNYIRHVYRPGLSDRRMLDSLAVGLQLMLFPRTPPSVLVAGPASADRPSPIRDAAPPVHSIGPLADAGDLDAVAHRDPFAGQGPQATRTIHTLLAAAAEVFAAHGFDAANVDQVVSAAGVSRGTFYRYFTDKVDLLEVLANECATALRGPFQELAARGDDITAAELGEWLHRFLALRTRYGGVLRVWMEGFPAHTAVLAANREVISEIGAAVRALFGPERPYALDRRAAGVMMTALLEHYPSQGRGTVYQPTDEQIVRVQAAFVERVILGR